MIYASCVQLQLTAARLIWKSYQSCFSFSETEIEGGEELMAVCHRPGSGGEREKPHPTLLSTLRESEGKSNSCVN